MSAAPRGSLLVFAWLGALLFAVALLVFAHAYVVTFGRTAGDTDLARGVLANVALFTVFALHHSLLARSGAKARLARVIPPALERPLYIWTASLIFIAVCLSWRVLPGDIYRLTGAFALAGYAVQLAGVLLTVRSSAAIGVLDLAGIRAIGDAHGGRSPARPPLLTSGMYGFVRHPLYFAWVLMVFGAPHMTTTRFVFAVVSTGYLALAIPFEERGLVGVFGDEYERYRRQVKWRMLPGVY